MDTSRALSPGGAGWVSPRPYPEPLWRARQAGRAWGESPSFELGEDGWPGLIPAPVLQDLTACQGIHRGLSPAVFGPRVHPRRSHPLQARHSKNCWFQPSPPRSFPGPPIAWRSVGLRPETPCWLVRLVASGLVPARHSSPSSLAPGHLAAVRLGSWVALLRRI